jgi:hypothetical protein
VSLGTLLSRASAWAKPEGFALGSRELASGNKMFIGRPEARNQMAAARQPCQSSYVSRRRFFDGDERSELRH